MPDYGVVRALVAIGFGAPHRVRDRAMVTQLAFEIERAAKSATERRLAAILVSDAVEAALLDADSAKPGVGAVLVDGTPVRIERGVRRPSLVRRRNPDVVVCKPDGRRVAFGLAALRPVLPPPGALALQAVEELRRARVSDVAIGLLTSSLGRGLRQVFGAGSVWVAAGRLIAEQGEFAITAGSRSDDDVVDAGVAVRNNVVVTIVLTVEETLSLARGERCHDRFGARRRLRRATIRAFIRVLLELPVAGTAPRSSTGSTTGSRTWADRLSDVHGTAAGRSRAASGAPSPEAIRKNAGGCRGSLRRPRTTWSTRAPGGPSPTATIAP